MVCRQVKQDEKPFGGMQVIFVGDFSTAAGGKNEPSTSHFAYDGTAWTDVHPTICYLTEQHRQEDADFFGSSFRNSP